MRQVDVHPGGWGGERRDVVIISVEPGRTPAGERRFSVAYRQEFLAAWDACVERGAKARLMRENNLGRDTVQMWLEARRRGDMDRSLERAGQKSKEPRDSVPQMRAELAKLRVENQRLQAKVTQSEAVTEILGKAYELLEGITTSSTPPEPAIPPALLNTEEYAAWLRRHKL